MSVLSILRLAVSRMMPLSAKGIANLSFRTMRCRTDLDRWPSMSENSASYECEASDRNVA